MEKNPDNRNYKSKILKKYFFQVLCASILSLEKDFFFEMNKF